MTEVYQDISLNELMIVLKQEVKEITLEDLYDLSFYFDSEKRYLPNEYKKKYTESVLNVMINRFISLKNDKKMYKGVLTENDVSKINELLREDNAITHLLNIIVIYATYFLKEPVHLPGTAFPGHVSVYSDGNEYFCPIKKHHMSDEKSVCKYCIARIVKD